MRWLAPAALCALLALASPAAAKQPRWWEGWSMGDQRLSQQVYDKSVVEDVPIVADDGTQIDARVIRPVVPPGTKVPAIMHLSPYFAPDITSKSIAPELQREHYVERGYALVGVSIRGSGGSGGCTDYEGARERRDVDAILDAIAAQPWSSGRIGGIGLSWDGTTLNAAAPSGNPHLKTIVPNGSITDWYRWSFLDGIPSWFIGYSFNAYAPPTVSGAVFGAIDGPSVPADHAAERACDDTAPAIVAQEQSAATGVRNDWWDAHDLVPLAGRIDPKLAVLQVGGSRDEGVRSDHLNAWDRALRARLANYRLLEGDWGHMWPDTPNIPAANNPDLLFNPHPLTSWNVLLLRWFDRWLKGKPTGIEAMPGALLQDDHGNWHGEDALDPSRAVTVRLYPAKDGTLATRPGDGSLSFTDDGQNVDPRGTCFYLAVGFFIACAPERTDNAQFFVGPVQSEPQRFTGAGRIRLRLRHSAPVGHVGVTLYDVDGDHWTPLTYGLASYNLRNSRYRFDPVEPGAGFEQTVTLLARDVLVPAGHRLAVAIGSQVGRYPLGLEGNGYLPVPSGGTTDVQLGAGTVVELERLAGKTELLPLK